MSEPAHKMPDPLEVAVNDAIALCDGDVRAALRAALVYNEFLERKLELMREQISTGYTRGRFTPARGAADRLEGWREIASGKDEKST